MTRATRILLPQVYISSKNCSETISEEPSRRNKDQLSFLGEAHPNRKGHIFSLLNYLQGVQCAPRCFFFFFFFFELSLVIDTLSHFCSCKKLFNHIPVIIPIKLIASTNEDFGGIYTLVYCLFPTWGEQTLVHISQKQCFTMSSHTNKCNKKDLRAGEMAQCVRTNNALTKSLNLVLSTHVRLLKSTYNCASREPDILFWHL